ncbi:MAG: Lrp/AsnC family transcriptional regulator [Gammaproteobacteria bacterium]|nr:MAG: Lrp/AsnC family transcriptional regulator [Gammaproteobacteria bacterium]
MSDRPLDACDQRMLAALQRDGRITNQRLAESVGTSAAACWRRLQRLVTGGTIRRFTAIVDPASLGYQLCALTYVTLARHSRDVAVQFERAVTERDEVFDCLAVTGDADFLLRIYVTGMAGYDRFLEDFLFTLPGVSTVRTSFVLREVKAGGVLAPAPPAAPARELRGRRAQRR